MFIDQCIGGQVPVKLIAGWLWSDSQMRTVFCVTLLLQLGKLSLTYMQDPFQFARGSKSNLFLFLKKPPEFHYNIAGVFAVFTILSHYVHFFKKKF